MAFSREGEEPKKSELSTEHLLRLMANPAGRAAAERIKRAAHHYLQRKREYRPLPLFILLNAAKPESFQNQHETETAANNAFLAKRIPPNETLFVPRAGMGVLIRQLKKGDYTLLEYYFRQGRDVRGWLYEAYFIPPRVEDWISIDLLEIVSLTQSAIKELAGESLDEQVRCLPILKEGEFTEEAQRCLLPYLENLFPLERPDLPKIKDQILRMPPEERFFVTVELKPDVELAAFKSALKRLLNVIDTSLLLNDPGYSIACTLDEHVKAAFFLLTSNKHGYKKILEQLIGEIQQISDAALSFSEIMKAFAIIGEKFKYILADLDAKFPMLVNQTVKENFYLHLIEVGRAIVYPIVSPRGETAQIVIPGKLHDICCRLAFGEANSMQRLLGFGKFTAADIADATRLFVPARIINIQDEHITGPHVVHGSEANSFNVPMHDIEHYHCMRALPPNFISNVINLAHYIAKEIGYDLSKLIYQLYDLDFPAWKYLNSQDASRNSLARNIQSLGEFYSHQIRRLQPLGIQPLFEYHLIVLDHVLKDPRWINKAFSHCIATGVAFTLDYATHLKNLVNALSAEFGKFNLPHTYEQLYTAIDTRLSATQNIFNYRITLSESEERLCSPIATLLKQATALVNIFKWTRNDGLTIEYNQEKYWVRGITNKNAHHVLIMLSRAVQGQAKEAFMDLITQSLPRFNRQDKVESQLAEKLNLTILIPHRAGFASVSQPASLARTGCFARPPIGQPKADDSRCVAKCVLF